MKIALLGDLALFGRFCLNKNPNLIDYFSSIRNFLEDFDVVVANLEAPFVVDENPIIGKSATLKAHPDNIKLLNSLGVTHVSLANNHIGDFGLNAYERTKKLLDDAGIGWFGTESKQIEIQYNKEKIALLGFCSYNTNPSPVKVKKGVGLNYLDVEYVLRQMEENKKRGYINILSVHSGQEHVHMPSSDDIIFARGLAEKFDYIYYGQHPHVIQGFEKFNNSSIFYSLGNFIFDDVYTKSSTKKPLIKLSEDNKTGGIGIVTISEGKIYESKLVPLYLGDKKLHVDNDVNGFDMININNELKDACSLDYDNRRNLLISNYIQGRVNLRNFEWYIKRLNFNSFMIILRAKVNSHLYRLSFSKKLKFLGK